MKLKNMQVVEEVPYGVYVALSNGKYVVNEDRDYLNIEAVKGDQSKIDELIRTAKSFGLENITVEFHSGSRRIDNEEHERQVERMKAGLVPDDQDVPAMLEYLNGTYRR